MKIHEYQASNLFKKTGIPVCDGEVTETLKQAQVIAQNIGYPVVLKAQVLTGGRGKAGGIKIVKDPKEIDAAFNQIKNLTIKGYPVERIFVVRALTIQKEFYVAVTLDPAKNSVVLIASSAGGVDIEETAKTNAERIQKFYLRGNTIPEGQPWQKFINAVFKDASAQEQGAKIFEKLLNVFFQNDCSLAEINPLVVDEKGAWVAADAKVVLDDNALFRHPEVEKLRDLKYEDADELEAKEANLSFVKLEGNVGCIVNGAGLAMATMDVIKLTGGQPANFLDVGGSSNPEKVLTALKIILRNQKTKSILINIFGGITRCDDIANGILKAKSQLNINIPVVVRLTGTNEKEAKAILAKNNITTYSSMREAVNKAVELAT